MFCLQAETGPTGEVDSTSAGSADYIRQDVVLESAVNYCRARFGLVICQPHPFLGRSPA
jgi:hypothetical protein